MDRRLSRSAGTPCRLGPYSRGSRARASRTNGCFRCTETHGVIADGQPVTTTTGPLTDLEVATSSSSRRPRFRQQD